MSSFSRGWLGPEWDDLLSTFYEAVLDESLWDEALRQLAGQFGHAPTSLSCFFEGKGQLLSAAVDPAEYLQYNQKYGAMDPHAARAPRDTPLAVMLPTESLVPADELERTPYYNEFMRRMGIYHGAAGILRADENGWEVLAMFRGKEKGAFREDELQTLYRIGLHARRARTVHHRLKALTAHASTLRLALDAMPCAVAICDERGQVVDANAPAAAELGGGGVLSIAKGGQLTAAGAAMNALRKALREAAEGKAASVPVARPHPAAPLLVNLTPLPHQGNVKRIMAAWDSSRAGQPRDVSPEVVQRALGLTAAEAQVALRVSDGYGTTDVAEMLGIQVNTVRTHLKRIYAKTGLRGRAELVRRVLDLR
jgi:DNA-binding CsgD family transcriptional regulator/PAS domain-containing protein